MGGSFKVVLIWMMIACSCSFRLGVGESAVVSHSFPEKVGQWIIQGKEEFYDREGLFHYMDGAAELYLAYGFRSLRVVRYSRGSGPKIVSELYEMASPEDAYGVFSFEREDREVGVGQGSEMGGGILRFWKGRYFVSVYSETDAPETEILMVGKALSERIPHEGDVPQILRFLPDEGLQRDSIRYFRNHVVLNQRFFLANENILQLGPHTEGVLARLEGSGGRVHLILIRYPNEQLANSADESFRDAYLPDAQGKGKLRTEDGKWTGAVLLGRIWVGIFGTESEQELERWLSLVKARVEGK
ncbi:MAG: DUF6599 family protein [Thermodesulfobacteriota bacterium]